MIKYLHIGILILALVVTASAQQNVIQETMKESKANEASARAIEKEGASKKSDSNVPPVQRDIDAILERYIVTDDSVATAENSISRDVLDSVAREIGRNPNFQFLAFNTLRLAAVIDIRADEKDSVALGDIAQKLSVIIKKNYGRQVIPVWVYSVYEYSNCIWPESARMNYLAENAQMAKDSLSAPFFFHFFTGRLIKSLLTRDSAMFTRLYSETRNLAQKQEKVGVISSLLLKNGYFDDLAYCLWVFSPILPSAGKPIAESALEQLAQTPEVETAEMLLTLFVGGESKPAGE